MCVWEEAVCREKARCENDFHSQATIRTHGQPLFTPNIFLTPADVRHSKGLSPTASLRSTPSKS